MVAACYLIDFLCEPQVKAYFLHLLSSPLSDEAKFQKFIEFCLQNGSTQGVLFNAASPSSVVEDQAWNMDELLSRVMDSVEHVTRRIQRSQHQDGGWGVQIEQSNFWHTAYAMLFLKSANEMLDPQEFAEIDRMLQRGAVYLEQHLEGWSTDTLGNMGGISVYDVGLMVRCFYRVGRPFLRREPALRVYRGLDRLFHAQNEDGGWDASLWGYEVSTPVRVWSDVGATGAALQALAETHDERFQEAVTRGMLWLAGTQNPDGSWNDGNCHPNLPDFQLVGQPSIVKTCEAVEGLLAGEALDLPLQTYRGCIDRAVEWLLRQTMPVLERQRRVSRWGWGYTAADYDQIGLILELLLRMPRMPDISPSITAAYVTWLLQSQRRQADDPEDGSWVLSHTARIGLALARFYRKQKGSAGPDRIPWIP